MDQVVPVVLLGIGQVLVAVAVVRGGMEVLAVAEVHTDHPVKVVVLVQVAVALVMREILMKLVVELDLCHYHGLNNE
jgi:uncharacterized hydantoinase/oxoprolinase family protein